MRTRLRRRDNGRRLRSGQSPRGLLKEGAPAPEWVRPGAWHGRMSYMQTQAYAGATDAANILGRIRTLLHQDDADGALEALDKHPRGEHLSGFERDLREWGFVYGMAFAIARMEDPWEPTDQVAERALLPAWAAFVDWSGEIERPDRDELVSAVVRAYRRQDSRAPMTVELEDALVHLHNGVGS